MPSPIIYRPLEDSDIEQYTQMLYSSFNTWYDRRGWGKNYFGCKPEETSIFYDIYNDLTPGKSIAAFDTQTGDMMGACFYHPREHHVSLGIMAVHPDYMKRGVASYLSKYIVDYTKDHGFTTCRLVSSAMNVDSFSVYNKRGFIPVCKYQDMVMVVPQEGLGDKTIPGVANVRQAVIADAPRMADLEMELSSIRRQIDYEYAINNPRGVFNATVFENDQNELEGFMVSLKHPALNMLGPCIAKNEDIALSLIRKELDRFRGTWVLFMIEMDKRIMVETLYDWNAVNVELHLKEVWGDFQPLKGIYMPSFLPETG